MGGAAGTPETIGTRSSGAGGGFYVTGVHAYAEEFTYTVSVAIHDVGPTPGTTTINTSSAVHDAPLILTGAVIRGRAGTALGTIVLANLTDLNSSATPSDYSPTVNWGDGTTSPMGTTRSRSAAREY